MDRTDRSRPLQALIGVWYSLGPSLRRRAWMRSWFGYPVSHVTCGRDIQRLGAAVRDLRGDRLRRQGLDENWDWAAWRAPREDWGMAVGVTDDAPADGPRGGAWCGTCGNAGRR